MSLTFDHTENDRIRYNVDITFTKTEESAGFTGLLDFTDTRSSPLLAHADKWYCTITRFKVPSAAIPLFIMEMDGASATDTIYQVELTFDGAVERQTVQYTSHNSLATNAQDDRHFFVYSYIHMLDMINTALKLAFDNLKIAKPALPGVTPFMIYNHDSQSVSLVAAFDWISTAIPGDPKIRMNRLLYDRFIDSIDSISGLSDSFNPSVLHDHELLIKFDGRNGFSQFGIADINPPVLIEMKQEYGVFERWTSLNKILIETRSIPVVRDSIGVLNSDGKSTTRSILTDFEANVTDSPGSSRTVLNFAVTGPYRLIDMNSHGAMHKLDFQVNWLDNNGRVRPIHIRRNESATLQFTFIRKKSYRGS